MCLLLLGAGHCRLLCACASSLKAFFFRRVSRAKPWAVELMTIVRHGRHVSRCVNTLFIRLPTLHTIYFGNFFSLSHTLTSSVACVGFERDAKKLYSVHNNWYKSLRWIEDPLRRWSTAEKSTTHQTRYIFHSMFSGVASSIWLCHALFEIISSNGRKLRKQRNEINWNELFGRQFFAFVCVFFVAFSNRRIVRSTTISAPSNPWPWCFASD